MGVIQTPDYFGNAFAQSFAQSRHYAQQEAERKRQEEAWKQYSSTFVPSQPMDVQQIQAPVSALPGQSGLGTQPSAPVQQPIQTQTEQVNMPSKDTYKQLEYQTGKEFAEKLKGMAGLAPQERQMAMRQLYADREQVLSNARYDKFSQDMEGIMAEYNPADPVASHKAKAKAIALGRRLKIDTGDVLKLFEEPKQNLQFAPDGTMFVNGKQASGQGQYRAPEKPTGQLTEYQRWQIANQQDKEPKMQTWEKDHTTYEKTHGMTDAQAMNEYWAMSQDPAQSALITPEKQAKYNVASARVNKYPAQPNLTKDEQDFLSSLDRSKLTQEQGFKMLQQYRMNKLNGIRQ